MRNIFASRSSPACSPRYEPSKSPTRFPEDPVFKIAPDGTETILYAFPSKRRGRSPLNIVLDKKGNLFGTVERGGEFGNGILFKLTVDGKMRVLHEFAGGSNDGAGPFDLIIDRRGNLFGDTGGGGTYGGGTIYKFSTDRIETVLHNFSYQNDGEGPDGLLMTKSGTFYGTAENDGCGYGDMFKLSPTGHLTLLHCFGMSNGWGPEGTLVRDATGVLYGTTGFGGTGCSAFGCGVVYKVTKQNNAGVKFRQSSAPTKMLNRNAVVRGNSDIIARPAPSPNVQN
jgi:uncharacterized repeat protein (TIGR03803 family)